MDYQLTRAITFHFTNWDTAYSNLIKWWRKTEKYTHVHLGVNLLNHYEIAAGTTAHWFPAANFDQKQATAYEAVTILVTEEVWQNLVRFLNDEEGSSYDWCGVAGFVLGWRSLMRAPKKWYCSSLCAAAYNASIGKAKRSLELPIKITPTELLNYLHLNHKVVTK